ncbi:MAG: hypothetical protein ABR576_16825 [Thermoanaerobaculia bacterium]
MLPAGSVAVAVMRSLGPTLEGKTTSKTPAQEASVTTAPSPRKASPSPDPLGSQAALRKNFRRKVVEGAPAGDTR